MNLRTYDMTPSSGRWLVMAFVALLWPLLGSGNALSAELLRHAQEARTVISWSVSEEELNRLMPEGWQSQRETKGPHEGANFFLVLADQHHTQPAGGNGAALSNIQAAVWTGPAAGNGEAGYMILGGMITPGAAPGDYGVYLPAMFQVSKTTDQRGAVRLNVEEWEVRGEGAEVIRVRLAYDSEDPHKSRAETHTYSGMNPEIERLYDYDEDALILHSRAKGIEGVAELEVDASGGPLARLLRGAELTAVISMPRVRIDVYLPMEGDVPLMSERQRLLLVGRSDPS